MMLGNFSYAFGHLCIFFGKISIQILYPFKNLGYLSLYHWLIRILYIFIMSHQIHNFQYFLSFWKLSFYFPDVIICSTSFQFWWIPSCCCCYYYFVACAFGFIFKKPLPNPSHKGLLLLLFYEFYCCCYTRFMIHWVNFCVWYQVVKV